MFIRVDFFLITTDYSILPFLIFITVPVASRAELMMMTVSDIVGQLIAAHEKGENVNLNK